MLTLADIDRVGEAIAAGGDIWIDLHAPTDAQIARVGESLDLHPLEIEDSQHFGQRPKLEEFDDHIFVVFFGAAPPGDRDRLVEFHIYFDGRVLLTVHREASPDVERLGERVRRGGLTGHRLLHAALDVLVDSFADVLDENDGAIDDIESRIFRRKLELSDQDIYDLRHGLVVLARVLHRQRDVFTNVMDAITRLPRFEPTLMPYFRDVRDHLWRGAEAVDTLRERVSGVTEVYLAAASNRMNVVMKQFTVIAGVFLPLSVIVGFFGMNFPWLVNHIDGAAAFWLLGVGTCVAVTMVLLLYFTRRGWLKDD